MSLQQPAELGGAMGGVGVVASIVYVSIQIRHNTRAVRASAFQQVVNSLAAISFDIAKDRNVVDLYLRARQNFSALSHVERAQYSLMLMSFLRRTENVFFQTEIRMVENEHWSGIRESIPGLLITSKHRIGDSLLGPFEPDNATSAPKAGPYLVSARNRFRTGHQCRPN